jgi:MoaA/NifB/PqqE/SkfB family radical SAM enzyme
MPKCLAFKHAVTIGVTGEVRPCCAWQKGESGVKIDDDWKTLHNKYYEESLHDWLPECLECQQDEESNGKSMRMWMNNALADSTGIEHWDLKINNTCNLSCVSCNSYSSSTWGTITGPLAKPNMKMGWHKEIEHIYPQLISAIHVKFTGGEPFMIPQVKKIIKYLIDATVSSNITLQFITNGTIDITSYYHLFESFKSVSIVASVDAIGERFEYLRRGAIWDQVSNNIIDMQNSSPDNTHVSITCLPSVLNINNIHEVNDWALSHGISFNRASDLIRPAYMAPHASLDKQDNRQQLIDHVMILDNRDGKDYKKWL